MDSYFQFNQLGKLEIIEIYEFYDRPILFSCRNASDNIFLAVLTEEEDDYESWMYVGVSRRRFDHIRSGLIDLHEAFSAAEDEMVFRVRIYSEKEERVEFQCISSSDIDNEWFPKPLEYLNLKTETLPALEDNLPTKSKQSKRDFVRIGFEFSNVLRTEAPAALLGTILNSFQEVINSIGQAMTGRFTEKGSITRNILEETELLVVGVSANSFDVELASATPADLFGESRIGDTMKEFLSLLNASDDEDKLKQHLATLKTRVAAKYLSFLRDISIRIHNTSLEWASPREGHAGHASISSSVAKKAIEIIKTTQIEPSQEYTIMGTLIGANIDKKNYEIWELNRVTREVVKQYRGNILSEAEDFVRGGIIGKDYIATIRETIMITPITDKIEQIYELVKLEDIK